MSALEPAPEQGTIAVVCGGQLTPADVAQLWDTARALVEAGKADLVVCDVSAIDTPDVQTVDAIARLQLVARRHGCRLGLQAASPQLLDLLELVGLRDVVRLRAELRVEMRRESEDREEPLCVQEERHARDLSV